MDVDKVLTKLNEILRHEWTGVVQYTQHSFVVQDLWREVYAKMFRDSAEEGMKHIQMVGNKIVALGGVPTVERNEIRQSTDLQEMLRYDLELEREAVRLYNEAIALCEDNLPLRVLLENIVVEEQGEVDELQKLLATQELRLPTAGEKKEKRAAGKVG